MAEVEKKETEVKPDRTSTHFGDADFYEEKREDIKDATWGEVFTSCCVHTPEEWGKIFMKMFLAIFFLYFFLFGLDLLGTSAKVVGGCQSGSLLGGVKNPIAGLCIGIIATVLVQSSSTTTSIVVSLVGAGTLPVKMAIYIIMGANIGTSVTNTIVSMGFLGNADELKLAFAAATVHDCFNLLSVVLLLPFEAITGYLFRITKAMVKNATVTDGDKWVGPLKKIVSPLTKKVIIANKSVAKDLASGKKESCEEYYPVNCPGMQYGDDCSYGLIACDKSGFCPAFFTDGVGRKDDEVSGGVCLFLGLLILCICLVGLVRVLQSLLQGSSTRILKKATNLPGIFALIVGILLTILVQSSSITTSVLTPFCGIGVIALEQMFPITLGANIGTTVTALLASLVSDKIEALQVSLAHLFFNLTGILIWYPVPFMRQVPLNMARKLGEVTSVFRLFPLFYIAIVFFVLPFALLGLSLLFEQNSKGFTTLGSLIVIILASLLLYFAYWWKKSDGATKTYDYFIAYQKRRDAAYNLPQELEEIKKELGMKKEAEDEAA